MSTQPSSTSKTVFTVVSTIGWVLLALLVALGVVFYIVFRGAHLG